MSTEMCVWGGGGRGVCAGRQAKGRVLSVCTCVWVHVCVCVCVWVGEGSVLYITHLCSDSPLVVIHCEIF